MTATTFLINQPDESVLTVALTEWPLFEITTAKARAIRERRPRKSGFRRLLQRLAAAIPIRGKGIRRGAVNQEARYETFMRIDSDFGNMISRICYGYSHSAEELEDLRQDVYVNLWQGIGKFNGDSSLKTWVYRVALNTCVSSLRSRSRRCVTVPLDSISYDTCDSDNAEEHRELITALYKCIDGLSPLDKAIVMMWLDGISYDEISETTGMARNTVATRLRRAKEKIKAGLEK